MKIIKSNTTQSGLYNIYYIYDDIVEIGFCNADEKFITDIWNYEKIKNHQWYPKRSNLRIYCDGYANKKMIMLHRFLMDAKIGQCVDHIDKNTLNNRISNLRFVTKQENGFNRIMNKNNTSGIMGVCWIKERNKWESKIKFNYKTTHLGQYIDLNDAIVARLKAEKKLCGEFAPQQHLFEEYGIL